VINRRSWSVLLSSSLFLGVLVGTATPAHADPIGVNIDCVADVDLYGSIGDVFEFHFLESCDGETDGIFNAADKGLIPDDDSPGFLDPLHGEESQTNMWWVYAPDGPVRAELMASTTQAGTDRSLSPGDTVAVVFLDDSNEPEDQFRVIWWGPRAAQQLSDFPDTPGGGYIGWSTVAYNPTNGKSLVFYTANRRFDNNADESTDDNIDYYAQVLNADGSRSDAPAVKIDDVGEYYYYRAPTAAFNPETGGWIVFYQYGQPSSVDARILSQQISADGEVSDAAPQVVVNPRSDPAFNPAGSFWVPQLSTAWDPAEERFLLMLAGAYTVAEGPADQPVGRFVNPDGSPQGSGVFKLMDAPNGGDYGGGVAFSTTSRTYLAAQQTYQHTDDDGNEISKGSSYQLLSAAGVRLGDTIRLGNPSIRFGRPFVAYNEARDEFLVVWSTSPRGDSCGATPCTTQVQRIKAADGTMVGDEIEVQRSEIAGTRLFGPVLATSSDADEFLVSWHQGGQWSPGQSVYARRMNGDGSAIDAKPQLISGPTKYAQRPSVAYSSTAGAYQITWQGYDSDGPGGLGHIYGNQYKSVSRNIDPPVDPPAPRVDLMMIPSGSPVVTGSLQAGSTVVCTAPEFSLPVINTTFKWSVNGTVVSTSARAEAPFTSSLTLGSDVAVGSEVTCEVVGAAAGATGMVAASVKTIARPPVAPPVAPPVVNPPTVDPPTQPEPKDSAACSAAVDGKPSVITFGSGSSTLTATARAAVRKAGGKGCVGSFVITGYVQKTSKTANDATLSRARARSVVDELRGQHQGSKFTVKVGKGQPSECASAKNRCVIVRRIS
jgi:outer membrane protein OmpA-like peptidoglycan-associated protein